MANYTANGTYTLPSSGGDYNATVDPGLTNVVFNLLNTAPATFNISSNTGSSVSFNADQSVTTVINLITNGGFISISPPTVNQEVTLNVTIDDGGIASVPGELLNSIAGGTVTFGSGGGTDQLGTPGATYDLSSPRLVDGFTLPSDVIDDESLPFASFTSYTISGQNVSGQQTIVLNTATGGRLSISVFGSNLAPGVYSSTGTGPLLLTNDGTGGTDIVKNVVCFARGTRVATPQGETAVEDLRPGNLVSACFGPAAERTAQPVKWLGFRRIKLMEHPRPETVMPVRIRKGAFAENVPHRDLLVSPDHAIFVDGMLISARQLVNHATIRYETPWRSVDYFHIELDHHAILLAEGLPAESYLDTGNRGFFDNSGEPLILHPDLSTRSDFPTRAMSSCAEFVWDEARVQPVWQRLADRATASGQPVPVRATTAEADLHIMADGRVIPPASIENKLFTFVLPRRAREVQVVSRAGTPTDTRPWLDDRRCLGVSVERIMLRDRTYVTEVSLDDPGLSRGWWDIERDGIAMRRWTNGAAVLPLPAFEGLAMLHIWASSGGMTYLLNDDRERPAATA
jgi:hypothetical protein